MDDVSFTVAGGEIFGILGPNGAGKTTTVECVEGLRAPDGGTISVLGLDPRRDRAELTQRVGVQLQDSQLPDRAAGGARRWSCTASFYRTPADWRELLERARAGGQARTPVTASSPAARSSGCRSRWRWSAARRWRCSTSSPPGLDPQARRDTWELIEGVRDRGVTIVLVTHFMEEAERLCDRVALIDAGRVVAVDTPAGLAERRGRAADPVPPVGSARRPLLTSLPEVTSVIHRGESWWSPATASAERGHLGARPPPDRGPQLRRGAGQPGGRLRRAHRPPRRRRLTEEGRA